METRGEDEERDKERPVYRQPRQEEKRKDQCTDSQDKRRKRGGGGGDRRGGKTRKREKGKRRGIRTIDMRERPAG